MHSSFIIAICASKKKWDARVKKRALLKFLSRGKYFNQQKSKMSNINICTCVRKLLQRLKKRIGLKDIFQKSALIVAACCKMMAHNKVARPDLSVFSSIF